MTPNAWWWPIRSPQLAFSAAEFTTHVVSTIINGYRTKIL